MVREIIKIDEDICNGCGQCVPDCPEGALQMIDGKARLVSDFFCDGLGACVGRCPVGAIEVEKREAPPYDEKTVMEKNIMPKGKNTILAHLKHMKDHGANDFLEIALDSLRNSDLNDKDEILKEFRLSNVAPAGGCASGGCPGSAEREIKHKAETTFNGEVPSELQQWPVQMHLISPMSPAFSEADFLLAADCTAFALGGFHSELLKGKALGIACPKLDQGADIYIEKIKQLIDGAKINTLTVAIMQVPCCGGLLAIAQQAAAEAERKVPIKKMVVSVEGKILQESWV